ncbi:MAG: hypothetical protein M1821_008523 [Bathelium mastoideum]|nr:MAG: hypothetical protein M1821_008523 [Bathelium mastoideum]KAI9687365.1 MAG: hypothetical protein M1822_002408 [Bathelium mastoideum]
MPESEFPLPAVQEALAPYIHGRSETLQIRQQINQYLFAQLENNDESSTHLARAIPLSTANLREIPPSVGGIRRSYAKALHAHVAAKAKLEELRTDLETLKHRTTEAEKKQSNSKKPGSTDDYVALLSLRRRQRRLEVVRQYLGSLTSEANDMKLGISNAVTKVIGDHPEAPALPHRIDNVDTGSDELTLKLKRAVLVAKHNMDRTMSANGNQGDATVSEVTLSGKVHALRHARDELISWIEEQLAKVPEDLSIQETNEMGSAMESLASQDATLADIEDQYKNYIVSRESLLRFIESTDNLSSTLLSPTSPTKRTLLTIYSSKPSMQSPTSATKDPSQAVALLPYISSLKDTSQASRALLSQNAFLRHQLAGAKDDRKATLERLAQESHLLPAGAPAKALAWNQAATSARKEMREFVAEKVETGEEALALGRKALDDVKEETRVVMSLQGDL